MICLQICSIIDLIKLIYEVIPISYIDKTPLCVACKNEFTPEDDIVVCPICGAPHHRDCWQEQGHCYYEAAHGTDLQWHPKEEDQQPTPQPTQPSSENSTYEIPQPTIVVQCPHCGKPNQGQSTSFPCKHCGREIPGFTPPPIFGNAFAQSQPIDPNEPIDDATVGKLSRLVMHRRDYYIPRFKTLKSQGNQLVSWNWSAFFLTTYWLAYRKCYLWAIFSSLIELIALVLSSFLSIQLNNFFAAKQITTYSQSVLQEFMRTSMSKTAFYLGLAAVILLLLRCLFFGLFGNLIYKKDCLKRAKQLDGMPKEDATLAVFKLSGISIFAPIIFYSLTNILGNIVLSFL